jgi:hypothetical protein
MSVTQERIDWARQREQEYGCQSRKAVLTEWRERWHEERGRKASWPESIAALDQPSQSCLKLYSQLKRQRAQRSFRLRLGGSAFGGSLPLRESLRLTLKSAYVRKAKGQPSMCFYTATTHRSEHGAEESIGKKQRKGVWGFCL